MDKLHIVAPALDNAQLQLIVLPTEQCNFRCTYCYEDFANGGMRPEVVLALKNLLSRRAVSLRSLHLEWFGGEPLVARRIIEDIGDHIASLRMKHTFTYAGSMTTNGSLLNLATASKLVNLGTNNFQISLDGFGADHDRTRHKANGSGTFSRIWENLLALRSSCLSFSILLRVHLSPDNSVGVLKLIDKINEQFSNDSRFSVFFKTVEKLGGPNDFDTKTFSQKEFVDVQRDLESRLHPSLRPTSEVDAICYASKANSWIVRSNGDLAKCTVALRDPGNRVGKLQLDGTITVDQTLLRPWLRGLSTLNDQDLSCPLSTMPTEIYKVASRLADDKSQTPVLLGS